MNSKGISTEEDAEKRRGGYDSRKCENNTKQQLHMIIMQYYRIKPITLCVLSVLCGLFFFFSCTKKLEVQELAIERDGEAIAVVRAEIARTEEERRNGLMYRKKLPDGEGMLFIYQRDEILSFWMKNTLIPLSIAFIASDGRIIEIKDMYPHDINSVKSSRSVRYGLEAPQGWFSRAGVKPGDVVRIP